MPLSIQNRTRKALPRVKFERMKDRVLGKSYELSLVFCGNALSQRLNRAYRGKDKPTNVLSFPLSRKSGEIFINLSKTKPFGALELYIHGLLHLKGMVHGRKMMEAEKQLLNVPSNRRRN